MSGDVTTARVVVSEIGMDMRRIPTDEHFASWLGLCPGIKITGGKVMSGKTKAATAPAHKLARLIYSMLTKGEEYTDQGQACYEERDRQRVLHNLNRRAQQLGMTLVPTAPVVQAA